MKNWVKSVNMNLTNTKYIYFDNDYYFDNVKLKTNKDLVINKIIQQPNFYDDRKCI